MNRKYLSLTLTLRWEWVSAGTSATAPASLSPTWTWNMKSCQSWVMQSDSLIESCRSQLCRLSLHCLQTMITSGSLFLWTMRQQEQWQPWWWGGGGSDIDSRLLLDTVTLLRGMKSQQVRWCCCCCCCCYCHRALGDLVWMVERVTHTAPITNTSLLLQQPASTRQEQTTVESRRLVTVMWII